MKTDAELNAELDAARVDAVRDLINAVGRCWRRPSKTAHADERKAAARVLSMALRRPPTDAELARALD